MGRFVDKKSRKDCRKKALIQARDKKELKTADTSTKIVLRAHRIYHPVDDPFDVALDPGIPAWVVLSDEKEPFVNGLPEQVSMVVSPSQVGYTNSIDTGDLPRLEGGQFNAIKRLLY